MQIPKWTFIAGVAVIIAAYLILTNMPGQYDDFARCLTSKGAKMYGSYLCTHCNEQKKMFGNSWRLVDYVECQLPAGQGETEVCKNANITAFPTWEFGDKTREMGAHSFEELTAKTGCKSG